MNTQKCPKCGAQADCQAEIEELRAKVAAKSRPDPQTIFVLSGSAVVDVYSSDPNNELIVVDWDADPLEVDDEHVFDISDPACAHRRPVYVSRYPLTAGQPNNATLKALDAASIDVRLFDEIPAHPENGQLAADAKGERCDLCQQHPSDEAALNKPQELETASQRRARLKYPLCSQLLQKTIDICRDELAWSGVTDKLDDIGVFIAALELEKTLVMEDRDHADTVTILKGSRALVRECWKQ